jgi:hypothetical protein
MNGKFDLYSQIYYYTFDMWGMAVHSADPLSWRDSIGRSFFAYYAYQHPSILSAMLDCIQSENGRMYLQRHPFHDDGTMSRDHTIYLLLALKHWQPEMLPWFVSNLKTRANDNFRITLDMNYWMHALIGKKTGRFNVLSLLLSTIYRGWNKSIYAIAGFSEESHQDEYVFYREEELSWWKRKWRRALVPMYSIANTALQLSVSDDNWWIRKTRKNYLAITGGYNYFVRLLLRDDSVSLQDVLDYKSMSAWRMGVWLNETDDRGNVIIDDLALIEYNDLERDYLIKLFWMTRKYFS